MALVKIRTTQVEAALGAHQLAMALLQPRTAVGAVLGGISGLLLSGAGLWLGKIRLGNIFHRSTDYPATNNHSPLFYSSLAFIVISAFNTLETGQPFLAIFAISWNLAWSARGTLPVTSR